MAGKTEILKHKERMLGWMPIHAGSADPLEHSQLPELAHPCLVRARTCAGCYKCPTPTRQQIPSFRTCPYLLAARPITRVENKHHSGGEVAGPDKGGKRLHTKSDARIS